jgi:cell division protein FtsB
MRDISRRIQRYRLSRYAPAHRTIPLKWAIAAFAVWALWAGVLSDHSLYRMWKLERTSAHERSSLATARHELDQLERRTRDPQSRLSEAERHLREDDGWSRPNEIIYRIDDRDTASAHP